MRLFNEDEALLRAWKNKLETVTSNRHRLKTELMDLLADNEMSVISRKARFTSRLNELLNRDHNQGHFWTPSLNWLFTSLSFLFPSNWFRPKSGSRLRNALETPPVFEKFALLSINDFDQSVPGIRLNNREYEDALFDNPALALNELKTRFHALNNPEENVSELIERVHALKYRLDSNAYQRLLEKLYRNHPAQTALYFYQIYMRDQYDTPENNDFIELHMLGQGIMEHFVRSTRNVHLHNHNIVYLLTLLTMANSPALQQVASNGQDPFLQLLLNWYKPGKSEFSTYDEVYEPLKNAVISRMDSQERATREAHQIMLRSDSTLTLTPLQLLKDCCSLFATASHPLLIHIARQSLEQMFIDYFARQPQESGYETISFITTQFVNSTIQHNHHKLPILEQWEKTLDTMRYVPSVPSSLRLAEKFAISLIRAIVLNDFNSAARKLRTQYNNSLSLSDAEVDWIIARVERIRRDLSDDLRHILKDTNVYDGASLTLLITQNEQDEEASSLEKRLEDIRINLETAKDAALRRDSQTENACIERALIKFHHCLSHETLDSTDIDVLYHEFLPQLSRHYITDGLVEEWQNGLAQAQAALLRWTAQTPVNTTRNNNNSSLIQSSSHLETALLEKQSSFQREFSREKQESQQAVAHFSRYMNNPSRKTGEMAKSLLEDLKVYLTEECYQTWKKSLQIANAPLSASATSASFFGAMPVPVETMPTRQESQLISCRTQSADWLKIKHQTNGDTHGANFTHLVFKT